KQDGFFRRERRFISDEPFFVAHCEARDSPLSAGTNSNLLASSKLIAAVCGRCARLASPAELPLQVSDLVCPRRAIFSVPKTLVFCSRDLSILFALVAYFLGLTGRMLRVRS